MPDSPDPRDPIHEAIQVNHPIGHRAVLTGWSLVAEWMDEHGERWLSKGHAAAKAKWEADGMLHEALYGDWPEDSEDRD